MSTCQTVLKISEYSRETPNVYFLFLVFFSNLPPFSFLVIEAFLFLAVIAAIRYISSLWPQSPLISAQFRKFWQQLLRI